MEAITMVATYSEKKQLSSVPRKSSIFHSVVSTMDRFGVIIDKGRHGTDPCTLNMHITTGLKGKTTLHSFLFVVESSR